MLTLLELPLPPTLALPIPAGARLLVPAGATVCTGETLAVTDDGCCLVAPVGGRLRTLAKRWVADEPAQQMDCLVLDEWRQTPVTALPTHLPERLRHAGIVGLGGAAYPAWRKWRPHLRWFIANAVESDTLMSCDSALLATAGKSLVPLVAYVGAAFAERTLFAVRHDADGDWSHPIVRRVQANYASGNERLLIQQLCQQRVPPQQPPADYGVVCFNIGTVVAMAKTLIEGLPLQQRIVTVYTDAQTVINVRVFLGTSLAEVYQFLCPHQPPPSRVLVGHQTTVTTGAVVTAATAVVRFFQPAHTRPPALPCIRCGDCTSVCPVELEPARLFQLAQDERWQALQASRLSDCLECRRCDDVCPSHIRLTDRFIVQKQALTARWQQQHRYDCWRDQHDRHQQRLAQQKEQRLSRQDIKKTVADLINDRPSSIHPKTIE